MGRTSRNGSLGPAPWLRVRYGLGGAGTSVALSIIVASEIRTIILRRQTTAEISPAEQTRRLESRIHDPRKIWKLSPMDLKSYSRWYDYSRARDAMFAASDTSWAPWYVTRSDDKMRARLNIISHLLSQVPYKALPRQDITLPRRQPPGRYREPDLPLRYIPTPF